MASDLYEIVESYGARDSIKVEAPVAVVLEGINAATLWTRSLAQVFALEHSLSGEHRTLKIPRAVLRFGAGGELLPGSCFDGVRNPALVTSTWTYGSVQVTWPVSLANHAAIAHVHDAANIDAADAAVQTLTATGCTVRLINRAFSRDEPMPFTLRLFWE